MLPYTRLIPSNRRMVVDIRTQSLAHVIIYQRSVPLCGKKIFVSFRQVPGQNNLKN